MALLARRQVSHDPPWLRLLGRGEVDANTILRILEVEYPPVDIEGLAGRLGIAVVAESPASDVSGRLEVSRETMSAVISVRRDHVRPRQRFTIAHEIGHLFLGHADEGATCYRFDGGPKETAANRFAADLLMPLWMVEPLAVKHGANSELLAKIFDVSSEAMNIRLGVMTGTRV